MPVKKRTCVVLGAGPSGLSTAWKLAEAGWDVEVLEAAGEIGGASRTFRWGDHLVDTGPHKIATTLPGILDAVKDLMKDELIEVPKQTSIYMKGKLIDYPFKMSQLLTKLSPFFGLNLGLSFLASLVTERNRVERSYEDWVVKRFGWELYRATFQGLAQKIWCDPKKLSADLARRRIVTPGMVALLKRVILGGSDKQAPSKVFHYPKMGIGRMNDRMRDIITAHGGRVTLNQDTRSILHKDGRVTKVRVSGAEGVREIPVDCFISTIPPSKLFDLLSPAPPEPARAAAKALKINPIMLALVEFRTPRLLRDTWIFFPETHLLFNRISEQKGFSEAMGPPDRTVICFDITAGHMPEAWDWPDEKILKRCVEDLRACGLLREEKILKTELFKIPSTYPIYDLDYRKNLLVCLDYLDTVENLFSTGRAGLFCYNNIDQCLDMSFRLAEHINTDRSREDLRKLLDYFDGYEIVD